MQEALFHCVLHLQHIGSEKGKMNLLNTKQRTEPQHNEQMCEYPNYSAQS